MTNRDQFAITQERLQEAIQMYETLKNDKRPALIQRLKQTIELGDTSENSEYDAAKEELLLLDSRIRQLQMLIEKAQLIEDTGEHTIVDIGSRVTISLNGVPFQYNVVGTWEVETSQPVLSVTSPVGQAIRGQKVGYQTLVSTPAGTIPLAIQAIA